MKRLFGLVAISFLLICFGSKSVPADDSGPEALAKATLRTLSTAAETYATANNGLYPTNVDVLLKGDHPYLNQNYCDQIISGYRYGCSFSPNDGYTFKATPIQGGKIFIIITGDIEATSTN